MEKLLERVFDILTQIKEQNSEILAALTPKTSRKYLSVEETAERLNRSVWTIRELCNSGRIKAVKGNDGCWKILADEVTRLEEEGVPTLPRRSRRADAAAPLASLRKQDADIVASSAPSYAQAG